MDGWIGQRPLWGLSGGEEERRPSMAMPDVLAVPDGISSPLPYLRPSRDKRTTRPDPVPRVRKDAKRRLQDDLESLIVDIQDGALVIASDKVPAMSKPRPRVTQTGHVYMPGPYMAWKANVGGIVARVLPQLPFIGQARIELTLRIWAGRGDADNLAGGIMDALNGIAWTDDRQIRSLRVDLEDRTKTSPRWLAVVRVLGRG